VLWIKRDLPSGVPRYVSDDERVVLLGRVDDAIPEGSTWDVYLDDQHMTFRGGDGALEAAQGAAEAFHKVLERLPSWLALPTPTGPPVPPQRAQYDLGGHRFVLERRDPLEQGAEDYAITCDGVEIGWATSFSDALRTMRMYLLRDAPIPLAPTL